MIANDIHNLNYLYELLRSGRRMRSLKCRTGRYLGSYVCTIKWSEEHVGSSIGLVCVTAANQLRQVNKVFTGVFLLFFGMSVASFL